VVLISAFLLSCCLLQKRLFIISPLFFSISNKNILYLDSVIAYIVTALNISPVIDIFYSVKKYLTFKRVLGIDHFDKNYNDYM